MKLNSSVDALQEPKAEKPEVKDAYRTPRLVTLGTAAGLIRFSYSGSYLDSSSNPPNRNYRP
jgi:hypothetical protein